MTQFQEFFGGFASQGVIGNADVIPGKTAKGQTGDTGFLEQIAARKFPG